MRNPSLDGKPKWRLFVLRETLFCYVLVQELAWSNQVFWFKPALGKAFAVWSHGLWGLSIFGDWPSQ